MTLKSCIFCQIASGELEAYKVYEDERFLAFLDTRPLFHGHVLLIARHHCETLAELPGKLVGPMFELAQRLELAIESAMEAEGTFIAMNNRISQSVPHLHVHVVPRRKKDGLKGFFWPRAKYESTEQMEEVRARIANAFDHNA